MSSSNPLNAIFGNQKFLELDDVTFDTYQGQSGKIIQVNVLETGLQAIDPPIAPPIGTGAQYDIPIFTGGLNPVFADSSIAIKDISTIAPATGKYIDLDTNASNTEIIGALDFSGNKNLIIGSNIFYPLVPSVDSDVIISNSSQGDKNLFIANSSGTGNNVLEIAGDNVTIRESTALKTLTIDINSISLADAIGNNNINMLPNSMNISTTNPGNTMQIAADSDIYIQSNQGAIISTASTTNTVGGDVLYLDSSTLTTLNQTGSGHYIQLSSVNGVTIASNSFQDLFLACDGNLRIKATSSFGTDGQILSRVSGGSGDRCLWANPIQLKRLISEFSGTLSTGSNINTRFFNYGENCKRSGVNQLGNWTKSIVINPSDYPTIGTLTPKLKLETTMFTNNIANVLTFTIQLHTYTVSGLIVSDIILTSSGTFGSSIVYTNPALNSDITQESTTFALPLVTTKYVFGVDNSAVLTSDVAINGMLYIVYE